MSKEQLKTQIDTDITNKTTSKIISPLNVGNNMKAVVDLISIVDGSETKLTPGNNIVITGDGTISFPYVINNVTVDSRPYKVYTALLTQTGTNAPVATVLENTLGGTVVWSRLSTGIYFGTLNSAFTLDKTFVSASKEAFSLFINISPDTTNRVQINTTNNSGTLVDGGMNKMSIEIRVYN